MLPSHLQGKQSIVRPAYKNHNIGPNQEQIYTSAEFKCKLFLYCHPLSTKEQGTAFSLFSCKQYYHHSCWGVMPSYNFKGLVYNLAKFSAAGLYFCLCLWLGSPHSTSWDHCGCVCGQIYCEPIRILNKMK